jgi:hypothetical protein
VLRPSADLAEVELARQIGRHRAVKAAVQDLAKAPRRDEAAARTWEQAAAAQLFREGAALERLSACDQPRRWAHDPRACGRPYA